MVMIGIEAITDEGLAQIGKRQRVAAVEQSFGAFHNHDIAVYGMFVAGLDTDTAVSATATADFARRLGIDHLCRFLHKWSYVPLPIMSSEGQQSGVHPDGTGRSGGEPNIIPSP
jgi:hypothetical protein